MKTNCSFAVNSETNSPMIAGEMIVGGSAVLRSVIDIITLWGVERIEANVTSIGQLMLPRPRFRPLAGTDVPKWVTDGRQVAMYHLGLFLFLNGIVTLEIEPDAGELDQIKARWRACEQSMAAQEQEKEQAKEKKDGTGGTAGAAVGSPAGVPQGPVDQQCDGHDTGYAS